MKALFSLGLAILGVRQGVTQESVPVLTVMFGETYTETSRSKKTLGFVRAAGWSEVPSGLR